MDRNQNYERVFKVKNGFKKYLLIFGSYILCAAAGTFLSLFTLRAEVILLSVAVLFILVLLTLKYLKVELEYSFIGGIFTVAKIYGSKTRKVVCELDLNTAILIDFATSDALRRANELKPDEEIGVCPPNTENTAIAVCEDSEGYREMIRFECDERTLSLLYRTKPLACSLDIRLRSNKK